MEATAEEAQETTEMNDAPDEKPPMPVLPEDPALDALFDMEIPSPDKGPSLAP
jgi:hypothetical protein